MPTFYIKHGLAGDDRANWQFVRDRDGNPFEYSDGKAAALAKDNLANDQGLLSYWGIPSVHSFFIYREAESDGDVNWRDREAARFTSGRYKPLLWADDDELQMPLDHFAHIAESDVKKVAFTESCEKGRADRQKVMGALEYMRTYVSGPWEKREFYASQMLGLTFTVEFAHSSDDIEAVYLEIADYSRDNGDYAGVMSCMTYHGEASPGFANAASRSRRHWPVHPVRVYGAGDLALAYMRAESDDDARDDGTPAPIVARALVWPERNICGRIYGPSGNAFRAALRAKGFSRFDDCALVGARMLSIKHPAGGDDCYVMPYIDGYHMFNWHDDGAHFVISRSGYSGNDTSGYVYTYEYGECEHCGENTPESQLQEIDGENWCNSCVTHNTSTCDCCGERVTSETSSVVTGFYSNAFGTMRQREEYWCISCLEDEASYCDAINSYLRHDEGFTCDECGEFFPQHMAHEGADGTELCDDCHTEAVNDDDDDAPAPDAPAPDYMPLHVPGASVPIPAPITLTGFEAAPAE
jgi:hypothetical protein